MAHLSVANPVFIGLNLNGIGQRETFQLGSQIEVKPVVFQAMRRATSADAVALYRAAVEWSLDDPIVINSRDDLISEQKWKGLVDPYEHQVNNLLTFCRRLPVTLLADDVGLGKTISAGLIASELMSRKRVKALLIVCPKILAEQWKEELWTKFRIKSEIAIGNELISMEPKEEIPAVITTYNSARLHIEKVPEDRFQMLILDEAHKLRNLYGTDNAPQVAKIFNRALEERFFKYVLMLTATPIQNRLWDLYSIVHLLTAAKGHNNPFGSPGQFKRKFIYDDEFNARQLRPESKDEFQSIVYSYMSRIRRNDSNLSFPARKVLQHKVKPSATEIELLELLAAEIGRFNKLTQIGLLKAFTSSPHALKSFCNSLAKNGTAPQAFADDVGGVVERITSFSKLSGLAKLLDQIRRERPKDWRAVVFTTSRETQTTIETYLASEGVKFGLINGTTGSRNTETLKRFRTDPPEINVIISTEAGAEGVNLQIANVLVNFDLPWNPMVVEQRIGRVQRLGSRHEFVNIYNLVLSGTFDEYIVGRLMEKLQMASHAIGDIDALLETSGLSDGEDAGAGVEEQIRRLVLSSLQGQDVDQAAQQSANSIELAQKTLAEQEKTINSLLGDMDDSGIVGPRSPDLPQLKRSMSAREFALKALTSLGGELLLGANHTGSLKLGGRTISVALDGAPEDLEGYVNYRPGGTAFDRLTEHLSKPAVHLVQIHHPGEFDRLRSTVSDWVKQFSGSVTNVSRKSFLASFSGSADIRAKAFVAHDSYETIISVPCQKADHVSVFDISGIKNPIVENAEQLGMHLGMLGEAVMADPGISEFCRFYSERRDDELRAANGDDRKVRKLDDEFTPRVESILIGATGETELTCEVEVTYRIASNREYRSKMLLDSRGTKILEAPGLEMCSVTSSKVPAEALGYCTISGKRCLDELLVTSEFTGAKMLPEFAVKCAVSGKVAARAETEVSSTTGLTVHTSNLRTSALSGSKAELSECVTCDFTNSIVLKSEALKSDFSHRLLRSDRARKSSVTGKVGDESEIRTCRFSGNTFLPGEGKKCELTNEEVAPGALARCSVSGKMVLPSELLKCAVTGAVGLKEHMVRSSVSDDTLLRSIARESLKGTYCAPNEERYCLWSNALWHPDDLGKCSISACVVHSDYLIGDPPELEDYRTFITTNYLSQDGKRFWGLIEGDIRTLTGNKDTEVVTALLSPGEKTLACRATLRSFFGLRKKVVTFLYSLEERKIKGKLHWVM